MMKRKLLIIISSIFLLFFNASIINVKAASYNYDVNYIKITHSNIEIDGWAILDRKTRHNVSPTYTLEIRGEFLNGRERILGSFNNTKEQTDKWNNCCLKSNFPFDYTKAYYSVPRTGPLAGKQYPTNQSGNARKEALDASPGSKIHINTTFNFKIPMNWFEDNVYKNKAVKKFYFVLHITQPARNALMFGYPYSISKVTQRIPLTVQSLNLKGTEILKTLDFESKNPAKKVKVVVSRGFVQGNSQKFLSDGSFRLVRAYSKVFGRDIITSEPTPDYEPKLYYGQGRVYDVVGVTTLKDISSDSPYQYYHVRVSLGSGNTVLNGGTTEAYIPSFWAEPSTVEGKTTFERIETCETRADCAYDKVDNQTTCPPKTATPNCCSLCDRTKSPNYAMYRITDFCTSVNKCGTCKTDKRCQITNGVVGNNCPTEKTNCCSLCNESNYAGTTFCKSADKCGTCKDDPRCQIKNGVVPSTCPTERNKCCNLCTDSATKGAYVNTDFCKTKCSNEPTCSNNPECVKAKLGSNSKCPVDKPSDPMSGDCCQTICAKDENKGTDYCTKICVKNTPGPTCSNNPECAKAKLGSNSKCPVNNPSNPMSGDCCQTICAKAENKGTDYCTKICNPTPPTPPVTCNTMTDPQEKYCCLNPGDSICKVYEAEDPDYDPSDSTSSEKKGGVCDPTNDSEIKFKYPAEGFGKITTTNTACKVSCQEELRILFKPIQSVRAGMGFKYPINTESTRYCTAEYSNQSWVDGLKAAALAAKNALNAMKNALNEAKKRDSSCGTSTMLTASVPSCPSPYTDGRSGLTCKCTSCRTCDINVWTVDGCKTPEYAGPKTPENPEGIYGGYPYDCNVKIGEEPCSGTTSITCPKKEEHQLSYVPDRCEKKICSGDRTDWGSAQSEISSYLNAAQSARNTYTAQISIINRYLNDRKTCNNYVSNNPYNGPKGAKIDIDIEEIDNQTKYIDQLISRLNDDSSFENARVKKSKNYTVYNNKKTESVSNPGLVGDHSARAAGFQGVYEDYSLSPNTLTYDDFWNKKSDIKYQFEFSNNYYVQKYTGELGLSNNSAYIYGGRFAYTDFYQQTGKYDLKLTAVELGPHLNNAGSNIWKIDPFKCEYNLTNLIFPPKGDINYTKYGNVGFEFRQISLTEPFPNRTARENWLGKESLITNVEYGIYNNQPLYHFNLNSSNREKVRFYNSKNKYDSFNPADPYKSNFLKDHNIILR